MTQQDDSQYTYDRHTDFRQEEQHLGTVVATIDATIRHREGRGPVYAGTGKAADIVKALLDTGLAQVRAIRDEPYFGRLDYSSDADGDVKSIYIGEVNVHHEDPRYLIVSRNAPIASLYYRPADGYYEVPPDDRHRLPRRRYDALVHLKRTLTIEDARLLNFDDVLRLPPGPGAVQSTSSRVLDAKLSGTTRQQLTNAIQTIQPEQYEQIAATQERVLIVQGAAGSGKSLVGLHRIDFILSPFSDIGSLGRPTAERVIMFGPSPAFLEYVSGLLPGLGIQGVRQTTVTQWLLDQFSSRVTLSARDKTFADLMNNRRKSTGSEIEAHLFKSGIKMKRLLDRYVDHLRRKILRGIKANPGIAVGGSRGTVPLQLGAVELRSRVADALKNHAEPNVARTYLSNSLAAGWIRLNPRGGTARFEAIAEATRLVEGSLSPIWPRIDFRNKYANLVSSPDKIMTYARRGDVDLSAAVEIARTAPSGAGQALGLTDLAAALYLDYSINGFESERFEHVLVDEAQDVSPLEIILMQMHSTNNSFSIMGDLRQSVLRYKSISNWNQIAVLFKREGVSRLDSRRAYRSTKQITQYANRILQGLPERTRMPVPHNRSGTLPKLVRSRSVAGMHSAIAESVQRLLSLTDIGRVAVLTKWQETANKIGEALKDEGIESVGLLTQDGLVETEVTVSPILLTKGLEFDAVIVANARKDNFYDSEFDRLLFYLACTRARHQLEIHWHGPRSAVVPDVARLTR